MAGRSARKSPRLVAALLAGGLLAAAHLAAPSTAEACGCFTPPDPSVPVVQDAESIAFEMKDGFVTAHIQIRYSGSADEFGWLLPLPSQPEPLKLGTDEIFAQLIAQTQPKYRLNREYYGNCPFDPNAGFGNSPASDSAGEGGGEDSPLVLQDSVGPFDYAVLRADTKQPMLDWLAANRYFVPTGTEDVVEPYIRPGAYFLALKLRKGEDVGDIQPVVVKYRSDLPMIPIVLTSVAANPNMPVIVWVLGESRAIPRNYYHAVLNDAAIDWLNFGSNYVDVVTRAVDEAPGHHAFVTEYAGPSTLMRDVLDYPGRFGDLTHLRTLTDAVEFVSYLNYNGYPVFDNVNFVPAYTSQMLNILQSWLPVPSKLAADGVTPNDYYTNFDYYINYYRMTRPDLFTDLDLDFDPVAMTDEIEERVVTPTLEAGAMFRRNSYLSRLFTTLDPEEMTRDPVFSFNAKLPEVPITREGRLIFSCGMFGANGDIGDQPATLITAHGFKLSLPSGTNVNPWVDHPMPAALRIEILREEGDPEVVTDNEDAINESIRSGYSSGGCAVAASTRTAGGLASLALVLGVALFRRRRRDAR